MKKHFCLFISLFISAFLPVLAQPSSNVKISINPAYLETLSQLGIPLEEGIVEEGKFLITDLYEDEIIRVKNAGIPCEIRIQDVASFYRNRYLESINSPGFHHKLEILDLVYPVPDHFYLGSMGGFCTYEQIQAQLDSMALLYPNLVKPRQAISSTNSIENRPIQWMKISDNPLVDESEPEVLYTGVHHAREPIGVQQLLYYMWYLLENYETDAQIKYIVDNTELYFVPVINPDGYVYNQLTNPQGGGNWRKNRRNTGGAYGIDINRNYGYMWGIDDQGSSPDPNEETYRGASAFSEPETQNIRDFCNSHEFRLCLNYHSYANKLLYPWGYTDVTPLTPDDSIFAAYAALMTKDNHYYYGPGATAIYMTNGGSDDWMYGEQTTKLKILAYTPEVGSGDDGFWPAPENIIPLCHQNMSQNLNAALLCLDHAVVFDKTAFNLPDIYGKLWFDIQKLGMETAASYQVEIEPLGTNIVSVGGPVQYTNLQYMETRHDSVYYQLVPDIEVGDEVKYLIRLSYNSITVVDTITKIYGSLQTISVDSCNTTTGWTGDWDNTTSSFHSATASITDSPSGPYLSFTNSSITTTQAISLPASAGLFLSFWAKWELEPDYDFVQIKISTNNGVSWTALSGIHTQTGTFSQAFMEPVYDGVQSTWVEEQIDLTAYAGTTVRFRFTLMSDNFVEMDGFYFDDFRINALTPGTGISDVQNEITLSEPIPNPSNSDCRIFFKSEYPGQVKLEVTDVSGKMVLRQQADSQTGYFNIQVSEWKPGVYFYSVLENGRKSRSEKLIVY